MDSIEEETEFKGDNSSALNCWKHSLLLVFLSGLFGPNWSDRSAKLFPTFFSLSVEVYEPQEFSLDSGLNTNESTIEKKEGKELISQIWNIVKLFFIDISRQNCDK